MSTETTTWKIRVAGYGTFDFIGTEAEAEDMRCHKARWEQAIAHKWRADLARESDRIMAAIAEQLDAGGGAPSALFAKLRKARAAEAQQRYVDANFVLPRDL